MKKNLELKRLFDDLDYQQTKIDKMRKMVEELPIELVKQVFPMGHWSEFWMYEYEFTMPLDFALEAQFIEFIELQGWGHDKLRRTVWQDSKEAGDFITVNVSKSLDFRAAFRSGTQGSTCVLNKIGEEMKPVYEVICSKGSDEGSF